MKTARTKKEADDVECGHKRELLKLPCRENEARRSACPVHPIIINNFQSERERSWPYKLSTTGGKKKLYFNYGEIDEKEPINGYLIAQ